MPQNYKDAIEFTWALGIGYIWINSLSIVQDSIADWAREAAKTDDIYTGAPSAIVDWCTQR